MCVPARVGRVFVLATALAAASGCGTMINLHFPDPKAYRNCVTSEEGLCTAAIAAARGPVELAGFRTASPRQDGDCTIGEVARGAYILRSVANEEQGAGQALAEGFEGTNALARRGLAGVSPPAEWPAIEQERLFADGRVFPGSAKAGYALTGVSAQQLYNYYWAILGEPPEGRQDNAIPLTAQDMRKFADAILDASANEAWKPVYLCALSRMKDNEQKVRAATAGSRTREQLVQEVNATRAVGEVALILSSYFEAYFRSGQFFDFLINPTQAEASLVQQLKGRLGLGSTEASALAKKVLAEVSPGSPDANGKTHLLTKLSGGFVTRGGKKLAFPDVDVTFTPLASSPLAISKIDLSAVAADVVRVFVEALGDSIARLPGDPQSTGCITKDGSGNPLLACFDPKKHRVSAENFAAINARANSVDAMVGQAVGSAVRGASWFSLNNEALAKVIETAAAVTARKTTEKVVWCYYACAGAATKEVLPGVPWPEAISIRVDLRR